VLLDVEVEVSYAWENSGIGSYEYWGSKEYDQGYDYIEIDNIDVLNIENGELLSKINRFIDNNWEIYSKQIEESILKMEEEAKADY
jgi:hypothetical protein